MPTLSALKRCYRARDFFSIEDGKDGRGQLTLNTERAVKEPTLVQYLPCDELSLVLVHMLPHMDEAECQTLCLLLQGLLQWQPEYRWSGHYALCQLDEYTHKHDLDRTFEVI